MFEKFKVTMLLFYFVAPSYPLAWAVAKQTLNYKSVVAYVVIIAIQTP